MLHWICFCSVSQEQQIHTVYFFWRSDDETDIPIETDSVVCKINFQFFNTIKKSEKEKKQMCVYANKTHITLSNISIDRNKLVENAKSTTVENKYE